MVRSCFIVGCTSGYNVKRYGKSHVFKIPSNATEELRKNWLRNIPKQEKKVFDVAKDTICHLHFEENYLVKDHYISYNGEQVPQGPRTHWKILSDAVPTKFSNAKVSKLYDRKDLKRKPPNPRSSSPLIKKNNVMISKPEERSVPDEPEISQNNVYPLLEIGNGCKVELPEAWHMQLKENDGGMQANIFKFGEEIVNYYVETTKYVQIFQSDTVTKISVAFDGRKLHVFDNYMINSAQDVNNLIQEVDSMGACLGISKYMNINECNTGVKRGQIWYSLQCKVQLNGQHHNCEPCLRLSATLRMCQSRIKKRLSVTHRLEITPSLPAQAKAYVKSLKRQMANKNSLLRRSKARSAFLRLAMVSMRRQMVRAHESQLLDSISDSNLHDNMKLSMRNAILNAKRKSSNGNRFESAWLLQCLLLKIKSPKAYRHLRSNNILPLPHPSTLQRLISGIPCEFGFTEFVFDQFTKEYAGKSRKEREGILMFDEIKVREEICYDKVKMQFNGFVDFGDEASGIDSANQEPSLQMADHALVFMYKSHYSKTMQPLGSFATKSAAPGETLAKLLISCIARLEAANVRISAVVSDGATTNKNMWSILGVNGKLSKFSNKIDHPCQSETTDRKRQLYFFSDVPHLLKCIRNQFFKHQIVLYNGVFINAGFYQAVYDLENKLTKGLRIIPKITDAHIHPSAFQKMRVYLATQVFSKSMADAIRFYRGRDEPFLRGSESTEDFTRSMNDLFDCLNACHSSVAVRLNSKEYKIIEAFKNNLFVEDELQTFCSTVTLQSLRVTLQSFLEFITYLVQEAGFKYVLTGKVNQDSLERFFGILRQVAGDEDHPTVISFMHLYRLLCLYTPTSKLVNGNVSEGEDAPVAMSNYVDTLLKRRKTITTQSCSKRLDAEDKLLKSIISDYSNRLHLHDHDYCNSETSACIVYQLCGYVAHRIKTGKQFTTCKDCKSSVSSYDECQNSEALLTRTKSMGALQYPSSGLYDLINSYVEPRISESLGKLHGDLASEIVDSITMLPGGSIGCGKSGHSESLIVYTVSFYITIRLYFFVKNFNRQIVSSRIKTKQQRKLSKLN